MKLSIRKVTKLLIQGIVPKDVQTEFDVTLRVKAISVEQPVIQSEGDDMEPIMKCEVVDGLAKL